MERIKYMSWRPVFLWLKCLILILAVSLMRCFSVQGQDSAISSALKDLQLSKTDTSKALILNELAAEYIEYDVNKVNTYAQEARKISERAHFNKGIGRSLVNIAAYNIRKANYNIATDELITALQLLKEAHDTLYLIRLYNSLGAIEFSLNQTKTSFENDTKALDLARESHDKKNELLMLKNMCNSYEVNHDYNKGLAYGRQALLLARLLKSEKDSVYIYDDIGLCYVGEEKYDTGRYYLFHSLAMDEKLGLKRQSVVCLSNIGESYAFQENMDKAIYYYKLALTRAKSIHDIQFTAMLQSEIGEIYNHFKRYNKAIPYFSNAITGLKNSQNYTSLGEAYLYMAESYANLGNYKKAYELQSLYSSVKDSINKTSNQADISAIENSYEVKKKQDEIELLKVSKTLKDSQIARQRLLLYGSVAGSILLLLLVIVLFNRARIKQRMKLLKHSAELEKKALQLQMNPHFIFNALGSISGFIASNDKANALKYLAKFSRLIRYTLESSNSVTVPLSQEIENLENYMELEKMRFNNKFSYSIQVAKEVEYSLSIPPMIIQPFLENAIIHGITSLDEDGYIRISFSKEADKVICIVEDNGIGRRRSGEMKMDFNGRQSMGIEITRKRLNIINSAKKSIPSIFLEDLYDAGEKARGTKVTIQFYPY